MNFLYSWSFSNKKNRGKMWYIIALSIAIGLIIWGALNKMYIMSFVIVLLSGVYFFAENNAQDNIEVSVYDSGIDIGGSFYDYSRVEGYSIVYRKNNPVFLRLKIKIKALNSIDLPINSQVLSEIGEGLSYFVEDKGKIETTILEDLISYLKI